MADQQATDEPAASKPKERAILIPVDRSDHAEHAFDCKWKPTESCWAVSLIHVVGK